MLRVVVRLICEGGDDKDVGKVGERLQGVSISTADGSTSAGLHELLACLNLKLGNARSN